MTFLKLYFQINVLLVPTYLIFHLSGLGLRSLVRPMHQLRLGQLLLVLSLVLPSLLPKFPRVAKPSFYGFVRQPIDEAMDNLVPTRQHFRKMPSTYLRERNFTASATGPLNRVMLFQLLIGLSLLIAIGRLLYRLRLVSAILRRCYPWKRIGRTSVVFSDEFQVPFSVRCRGRAYVALPEYLLHNSRDLRVALRHELQHHRQFDTQWAITIEWIASLFVLNPVVHLWKRRIHEFQELSCDEALIGRKKTSLHDYGGCLVRVAETALGNRLILAGTTGMTTGSENPNHFKSFLKRRIDMLTRYKDVRPKAGVYIAVVTIAVMATIAIAYASQESVAHVERESPNPGDVKVDPQVQKIAEETLGISLKKHDATAGFAIVADPNTGRVLAVANIDSRKWMHKSDPFWSLSTRVEPASVMKSIVAAAALERGTTTIDEMHSCENGRYVIAGKTYEDWTPFDKLSTRDTIVNSSNLCGIKIAEQLGVKRLLDSIKDFGIGEGGTASHFPAARPGFIASLSEVPEPHLVAQIATGFAIMTSPLEIVEAYSAIANGGNLMEPILIGQSPKILRRVLSEKNASAMRSALMDVVNRGTAKLSQGKHYRLAGKTGTAYSPWFWDHEKNPGVSSVATFVGFAPAGNPKVIAYVGIEDPRDQQVTGSFHAAPLVRDILEGVLEQWDTPYDFAGSH